MNAQAIYLSHGGGPLPILGDHSHAAMVRFMEGLSSLLRPVKAIIVFSAHWEERTVAVLGGEEPGLYYDYWGFPKESYELTYPLKNDLSLAHRVAQLLGSSVVENRGWDHGVFIPLLLSYPKAEIPAVQVSMNTSLDAEDHYTLGERLRPLLDEEILFIGSGFSYHNIRGFGRDADAQNEAFQEYLIGAATEEDPLRQKEFLVEWEQAPYARACHPRAEHLLPLHVCAGFAQRSAQLVFDDQIMGKRATAFLWS
jgi:4,5-DOPA dioxygenase extradiol